jgi:soluble lytic murein transglycosylase-like protein
MDPIDAQIAALESEIAQIQADMATPTTVNTVSTQDIMAQLPFYSPLKIEQAKRQLQFDVPMGIAKAGAGLADVLSYPVVKGLEYAGAPVETFGLSKLLSAGAEQVAPTLGVEPNTATQELVSFLTPSPLSKAKLLGQAGTGLAAYLGSETAQAIAPESEYAGLVGALAAPATVTGVSKLGAKVKQLGEKIADVPPALQEETASLVQSINDDIAKLSAKPLEVPSRSVVTTGAEQINNIIDTKKNLKAAVTAAFKDPEVYNANVPTAGLRGDVKTIVSDWSGGRKTQVADQNLDDAIKKLEKLEKPKLGQALAAFTTEVPNEVSLGELHKLQIQIGKSLPSSGKETFTPDEALAGKLYEYIGNLIDNTPGGEKLVKAKELSKAFRDAFVWNPTMRSRAPLATAQRRDSEKVISYLTGGSSRFEALQNAGVDITPLQNQLVNEFSALKTPKAKLRWIEKNRPVLQNSPFWTAFEDAGIKLEAQLEKVEPLKSETNVLGKLLGEMALSKLARVPSGGIVPLALALGRQYGQEAAGTAIEKTGGALATLPQLDLAQALQKSGVAFRESTTEQTAPAKIDIDAQIEAVAKEIEALKAESAPAKKEVKVGKQNISIPEGDEFAPPKLVRAVMQVESGGKVDAVSPKGARGPMQLMPATAKDLGVDIDDPKENVEGGSKYLQRMLNKYGSKELALAAYNWGPGNIDRAIKKVKAAGKKATWQNVLDEVRVPKETRNYVSKVINLEA